MTRFRKLYFFKFICMVLIGLFTLHVDVWPARGAGEESPGPVFQRAKADYLAANYERAAVTLLGLVKYYESKQNDKTPDESVRRAHGRVLLLLGACREQMGREESARSSYAAAGKLLGKTSAAGPGFIDGVALDHLKVYADVFARKEQIQTHRGSMIAKTGKKNKKKKFPWLLVIGGTVVMGTLVYFLLIKKSKKYTLTVNTEEGIDGTPAKGSYKYKKGEKVNYNFSLQKGYRDLSVTLDGSTVPASGSFIMDRNRRLNATGTKIGRVDGVTVAFTVRFAATNLKVRHHVEINGQTKIDETFHFNVRSSSDWSDAKKIYRYFNVSSGDTISIRQEAGPYYNSYYGGYYWIWGTYYYLEIIHYTYTDGADPGWPGLSEDSFFLYASPWEYDPGHEWYRIKTRDISILQPEQASRRQKNKPLEEGSKKCSGTPRTDVPQARILK